MEMGGGVGIEPRPVAVHRQLSDHAFRGEQVERVVDRGFGDPTAGGSQFRKNLVGRTMLRRIKKQRGDLQARRGRLDTVHPKPPSERMRSFHGRHGQPV